MIGIEKGLFTMIIRLTSFCLAIGLIGLPARGQEPRLVDFQQHIQPIFQQECLNCHGPKDAKNDFRVDDRDSLLAYIEPGSPSSSSLWTDYLRTDDPEMLMPPASDAHPGGLAAGELLLVKAWIEEGAEGSWASEDAQQAMQATPDASASKAAKLWSFQGLFHPAMVHFPVALLSVSALFVLLSFVNRTSCEPVAFHCLWIGALGAVAACLTGWSYAVYEGYGKNIGFDLAASALDRHRWAGVFVALFSLLTLPLAVSVRRNGSIGKRMLWLMASCIAAGAVSVAGYQGGELTYGEDHYMRYFEQLFPPADAQTPDQQAGEEQNSQQSETQSPDEKTTEPSTAETKTPSPETADSSSTPDSPQAEVTTPEPTEPASRESSSAESTSSEPSVAEPSATEAPAPDATEPQTPTPESASPNAPSQPEAK
jgi:uncharacterized membrane protein